MFRRAARDAVRQQFDAQVEVLAAALIAAFDTQGIELKDASRLLPHVDARIDQEIANRTARRLAEIEAGRSAWQREHGHLDRQALADLLALDARELPTTAERIRR